MRFWHSLSSMYDILHSAHDVFDIMHYQSVLHLAEHGIVTDAPERSTVAYSATAWKLVNTVEDEYQKHIRRGLEQYCLALRSLAEITGEQHIIDSFDSFNYAKRTGIALHRTLRAVLTDDGWFSRDRYEDTSQFNRMIIALHDLTSLHEGRVRNSVHTMAELLVHYTSTIFALWLFRHDQLIPMVRQVVDAWQQDERLAFSDEKDQADTIRLVIVLLGTTVLQQDKYQDVPWAWHEHALVSQITDPEYIQNAWQNARSIVLHTSPIRATLGRLSLTPWWLQW